MNEYAPSSSLGWLDLDTAASERVTELLRALDEPSTLDVLGLGTIRDAFADMLSPGTSTVQTRLRYFVFVPWIYQRLEARRLPPAQFARKLREAEAELIDRLRPLGPNQGVIGYRAGRNLKRMPSDIYWGGLVAWGIRRRDMSPVQHAQRATSIGRHRLERDDDGNATSPGVSMWADLPPPPDHCLEAPIDFNLRADEAEFLVDRIKQSQPGTLLAVLSAAPEVDIDVEYPWLVEADVFTGRLADALHHARCFSELSLGPQLVYGLLVALKARADLGWKTKQLRNDTRKRLKQWSQTVGNRRATLQPWVNDPSGFRELLADYRIAASALDFWHRMARLAVDDPAGFAENSEVHQLIRDRERRLKSRRARLTHRSALENLGLVSPAEQLDYRWGITKAYLTDLAAAGRDG